ncbi:MAG TPA: alpha/beta hydrolase [Candidatus Accumulibacter sp.]|nr:alpha/beta hydrolase [Accumulibacter sp.]
MHHTRWYGDAVGFSIPVSLRYAAQMTNRQPVKLLNILVALVVAYAIFCGLVFAFQERLLYFPLTLAPDELAMLVRDGNLRPWRPESLHAYLRQPEGRSARATVVVFHGNAGTALHRDMFTEALVPLGFRVILAEYPGYAGKPGSLGEASLVADAVATLRAAREDFPGPLIGWGESLGAGVLGAALAGNPGLVDGIVLMTPWDSLADVASHHYPYLPVRWMLRDRYDTVANLQDFPGPAAVLLATEDQVIPARFGHRLFDALSGRKILHIFPGADHNSWPFDPSQRWWGEVMRAVSPGAGRSGD